MIRLLFLIGTLALSLACTSSGGDDNKDDSAFSANAIGTPGSLSGKLTGDYFSQVTVTAEAPDGSPLQVRSNSIGEYFFPASSLAAGTSYKIYPSKDHVDFTGPSSTRTEQVVYQTSGISNVDFASRFNYPDRRLVGTLTLVGSPIAMAARPDGVSTYVSMGPLDDTSEDPSALLANRTYRIRSYDNIQDGQTRFDTVTGEFGAIQLIVNQSSSFLYALNRNANGGAATFVSYALSAGAGLGASSTVTLDGDFVPTAMAISPDNKVMYVCSETSNEMILVQLGLSDAIDIERNIPAVNPISVAATNEFIYVITRPVNDGINTDTVITKYNTNDRTISGNIIVPKFKASKIVMAPDLNKYLLLSEAAVAPGGTILAFNIDGTKLGEYTFTSGTPRNIHITDNNKEVYVPVDSILSPAQGEVVIMDLATLKPTSTIFGMGRNPTHVSLSVNLSPINVNGMVANRGSTDITVLKN